MTEQEENFNKKVQSGRGEGGAGEGGSFDVAACDSVAHAVRREKVKVKAEGEEEAQPYSSVFFPQHFSSFISR